MLKITESARDKIRKILEDEGEGRVFHISVRAGGCNGFKYVLYVSDRPRCILGSTRTLSVSSQLTDHIYIDGKSWELLDGAELDYEGGLKQGRLHGFFFKNPKAESTCGCGLSFASI